MTSKNKLTIVIWKKYFDNLWYKHLVVLANPKSILNINYAPKDIKNSIVRVEQLVKYIEKDLKHYDKDLLLIKRPKNIEELKLILSEIKVKCHGEEIIKIINK